MTTKKFDSCPHRSSHERRWSKRILDALYAKYREWVWEDTGHRREKILNVSWYEIGSELLMTHKSIRVDLLLQSMINKWITFDLFALWIMKAFEATKDGIAGYRSVNAYVADITHPDFRYLITKLMPFYSIKQRSRIVIELVEQPHGEIDGKFISNVAWLREMWFKINIDDCDILWIDKNGISIELVKAVGPLCHGIKLDHKTSQEIARWQLSAKLKSQLGYKLRSLLENNATNTAEWIRSSEDVTELRRVLWIMSFQLAPVQYRKVIKEEEL